MAAGVVAMNVVIGTHGRCELLNRTLESLTAARRPEGFGEVWVVENGSDAGARQTCQEMVSRLPVRYEHLEQAGKSRALQHALEIIKQGLVIFLDDDVRVVPELFEIYAAAVAEHGAEAIYGGPLLIDYERRPPEWLLDNLPPSVSGWQPEDPEAALVTGHFLGANFGAYAEAVLRVGGVNLAIGPGAVRAGTSHNPIGIETDMQMRLRGGGCKPVYLPGAKVWHYVPRERCTPGWTLHRHYRTWMTNGMMDQEPYPGPRWRGVPRWMWRRALVLWCGAVAAWVVPSARRRFEIQKKYYQWRGYMAGLRLRDETGGGRLPGDGSGGSGGG